jgi:hypothetical protein
MASFSLTSLFSAVHEAIVTAAQDVEEGSWTTLKNRYFHPAEDGSLKPKTVRITLPHTENGQVTEASVEVPLFSLSSHRSLTVDELSLEFEVDLRKVENGKMIGSLSKRLLGGESKAKVEIKFKGAESSEGVMLINDKIHQSFPK